MIKIIIIPIVFIWSVLPWGLLYLKSRTFYYFVYYILGYRKQVVYDNLKNSFPEKSDTEIKRIRKDFYKHFCDLIYETIKMASMSSKEFEKRCKFTDHAQTVFNKYAERKQTIVAVLGHCGNWEWNALAYQAKFKQNLLGVYHPLSSKGFDELLFKWRTRFGATILPDREFYPFLIKNKNTPFTIGLIADQSAPPESSYWTAFLNQDTAVFNGPEKVARKFGYPVVYVHVRKTGRGYYELDVIELCEDPKELHQGEITALHVKALEKNILDQPEIWLWSHRRWKHKRPASTKPAKS